MCGVRERFRQLYLPDQRHRQVKLEEDDVTRICQRVVGQEMATQLVADQFDISRRRVQQLAKTYRETGEIPALQTPGRKPYADLPDNLEDRILKLEARLDVGAVTIAHILQVRDGLSIGNDRVHAILGEHDRVTEQPRKQGRRRPWVRWEREHSLVTVHLDWYQNNRGDWVLAVEDDASRNILGMIEEASRSAARIVELLDDVVQGYSATGPILEVITDHGSELYANKRDDRGEASHPFEEYLADQDIEHTLRAVGRPQSNGKIERFFQTYDKQRWRFSSLDEFLDFYNQMRPHMSLDWDALETSNEAFDRLLPSPDEDRNRLVGPADSGGADATK